MVGVLDDNLLDDQIHVDRKGKLDRFGSTENPNELSAHVNIYSGQSSTRKFKFRNFFRRCINCIELSFIRGRRNYSYSPNVEP
jgi:hypothetical protein